MPTADASTTKEVIAQLIRRRNALQAQLPLSSSSGGANRSGVYAEEVDIARKLSFSAALVEPVNDADEPSKVQVRVCIALVILLCGC